MLGKVQAEHSWMWSHQLWEVISARPGAKQCMLCAGQGGMGTFVPQVPKDVLEKMAEHKKGEESSPGSPAVGQPPHGGDNKRYWLVEVAVGVRQSEGAGMGFPCARGNLAVLIVPLLSVLEEERGRG